MRSFASAALVALAALSLLAPAAHAQELEPTPPATAEPRAPVDAPAMAAEVPQPFLYRVQPTADVPPSYLFGTVHVRVGIDDLHPVVVERMDAADAVALEADIRRMSPFDVLSLAQYGPGESLSDHLTPEQIERLIAQVDGALPAEMIPNFRPWFVMTMQLNALVGPSVPLDLMMMTRAEERHQQTRFLETWQDQLGALQRVPEAFMVQSIVEMLDNEELARAELDRLLNGYRSGSADVVESIVIDPEELAETPEFFEEMLFNRNDNWVPILDEWFRTGNVFVAVGVGHLVGDRSVIDGLEARGYVIERVDP